MPDSLHLPLPPVGVLNRDAEAMRVQQNVSGCRKMACRTILVPRARSGLTVSTTRAALPAGRIIMGCMLSCTRSSHGGCYPPPSHISHHVTPPIPTFTYIVLIPAPTGDCNCPPNSPPHTTVRVCFARASPIEAIAAALAAAQMKKQGRHARTRGVTKGAGVDSVQPVPHRGPAPEAGRHGRHRRRGGGSGEGAAARRRQ